VESGTGAAERRYDSFTADWNVLFRKVSNNVCFHEMSASSRQKSQCRIKCYYSLPGYRSTSLCMDNNILSNMLHSLPEFGAFLSSLFRELPPVLETFLVG
jgi:hypothetical protein